jgi:hypothetical protein
MENKELEMFNKTVKIQEDVIFVQPFCDFFNIHYKNQLKIINNNKFCQTGVCKKRSMLLFGDNRERICLTKRTFIAWILQINPQIVHPNLQEKLLLYQTLIFDYMFGSLEREEKTKIQHTRLQRLKALKTKISAEISLCEKEIKSYLDSKFQYKLDI